MVLENALRILKQFAIHEVDYVLVGGVTLNLHGIIRTTEDIDLFIKPKPDNIERLKEALKAVYSDPDIDDITAEDFSSSYPIVRYIPPDETLHLDLVAALGFFTSFEDLEAEQREFDGVNVSLATPRTLYWLKRDTLRLIDKADAEALRKKFDLER